MWKKAAKSGLIGLLAGIAAHELISLAVSALLRLGYYMPFPAWLPERVGGEMNATALLTLFSGLLGAGAGLALSIARCGAWGAGKRALVSALALLLALAPAAAAAALMWK